MKDIVKRILLDKPIAYRADFAKAFGGVKVGVFLSQMFYWWGKSADPQWIRKTQSEFYEETGLTRREQDTARIKLSNLDILKEKLIGNPPQRNFKINFDKLIELLQDYYSNLAETYKLNCPKAPNQFGGNGQIDLAETDKSSLHRILTENTTIEKEKLLFNGKNIQEEKSIKKNKVSLLSKTKFIVQYFNRVSGKKIKFNDDRRKNIEKTLANESLKTLLYAIHNMVKDSWSTENKQIRLDRLISPGRRASNLERFGHFPFKQNKKITYLPSPETIAHDEVLRKAGVAY